MPKLECSSQSETYTGLRSCDDAMDHITRKHGGVHALTQADMLADLVFPPRRGR